MESLPDKSNQRKIPRREFLKKLPIIAGSAMALGTDNILSAPHHKEKQTKNVEIEKDRKSRLQKELNFNNIPGSHTLDSVVVGSRHEEVERLIGETNMCPELIDFEKAIYVPVDKYIIPVDKKDEAERIAERYFSEYVKKYKNSGVTIENSVHWTTADVRMAASDKTFIDDAENNSYTWRVCAVVENKGRILKGKYLPRYVVAYHELMHVEEIERGEKVSIFNNQKLSEILPTTQTIILLDRIYKELFSRNLSEEIDYEIFLNWGAGKVALGKIANFYRKLEEKYGGIGLAMASQESLEFLYGKI